MSDTGVETDIERGDLTEIGHENLGNRLQSSCAGMCIGLLLFFGAFPLLYWNEARAVDRYEALDEAESQVTTISSPWKIDDDNDGKLIHFSVNITNGDVDANGTTTPLVDPIFGTQSPNGLKFQRQAEMYQWVEHKQTTTKKNNYGGGTTQVTTYSYGKEWKNYLVNSYNFKDSGQHQNPSSMEFTSQTFVANSIKIGAYELPQQLFDKIDWFVPLEVTLQNITNEGLRGRARSHSGGYYFSSRNSSSSGGGAQIGDQQVFFREASPAIITIVGVQHGKTLGAFVSKTGEGGDVLLFKRGNLTSVQMFDAAEEENRIVTWIIRFVGFAVMALGLYLVFRPIGVFADVIPCVGSIIGCGLKFMAVVISAILSVVTISVAWLAARPKIGAIVLCVSIAVIGLCALGVKKLVKRKNDDDDNFIAPVGVYGGKVVEVTPAAPTAVADEQLPTVYALPEEQIVANVPPQPYVAGSAQPYQTTAEPYVYVPKV